jgi:hypothetical protein
LVFGFSSSAITKNRKRKTETENQNQKRTKCPVPPPPLRRDSTLRPRYFGCGRPYVNGNREQTNNYTIDSVDMNESIDNLVAYRVRTRSPRSALKQTTTRHTGNVAGSVISNVLKSGSNLFRGNVFEYYRNSDMDANSWSNNRSHAAKPERRQDIYGGTLGGPLLKNKLFFFGNYQGTRAPDPTNCRSTKRCTTCRRCAIE